MKVDFDVDAKYDEDEVVIRCKKISSQHLRLQQIAEEMLKGPTTIELYDQGTEYFYSLDDIYFFETDGSEVYAHTRDKHFQVKKKLYELENELPAMFFRSGKAVIINLDLVYSVTRNITSSSVIEFYDTPKKSYVSRGYYNLFKDVINERRRNLK